MVKPRAPLSRRARVDVRAVLMTGVVHLADATARPPDLEYLRGAWAELADDLMATAKPGCRPWAWWVFAPDAPRVNWPLHVVRGMYTRARSPSLDDVAQLEALVKAEKIDAAEARLAIDRLATMHEGRGALPAEIPAARRLAKADE